MNRTVFFLNGRIMEVQRGNRYLKKQIAVTREIEGHVPYRFSAPYSLGEIKRYWEGQK